MMIFVRREIFYIKEYLDPSDDDMKEVEKQVVE